MVYTAGFTWSRKKMMVDVLVVTRDCDDCLDRDCGDCLDVVLKNERLVFRVSQLSGQVDDIGISDCDCGRN